MEGGELFSRIQAKGDQAFTEKGEAPQMDGHSYNHIGGNEKD